MSDLERRIKEAAEKATPGEWEIRSAIPYGDGQVIFTGRFEKNMTIARWNFHYANTRNDIQYIALASPANILALLAKIERLEDALESVAFWGDCELRPESLSGEILEAFALGSSKAFEQQAQIAYDALAGKGE